MAKTQAQIESDLRYRKEKTRLVTVQMPLREWESLDAYCQAKGEGKATLIRRLIAEEMNRDGWNQKS